MTITRMILRNALIDTPRKLDTQIDHKEDTQKDTEGDTKEDTEEETKDHTHCKMRCASRGGCIAATFQKGAILKK